MTHTPSETPPASGDLEAAMERVNHNRKVWDNEPDGAVMVYDRDLAIILSALSPRPDFFAENAKNPGVVVPREPTEAMRHAGKMAAAPSAWHYLDDAYRAMLAAAPRQQGAEVVAWRGEADGIDDATTRQDTAADWRKYGRKVTPLYAPPSPCRPRRGGRV